MVFFNDDKQYLIEFFVPSFDLLPKNGSERECQRETLRYVCDSSMLLNTSRVFSLKQQKKTPRNDLEAILF